MAVAFCPECETGIKLGNTPREGQQVTCPECGAELEVISLKPLELDWAYEESEEDWDDGWDSEDDDGFDADFDDWDDDSDEDDF